MTWSPEWATTFVSNLHPISLALAPTLPCIRALVRFLRNEKKCWIAKNACHDAAAGLVLPSFVALTFFPMVAEIWRYVDAHVFTLAGAWGIIYMFAELFGQDEEAAPTKPIKARNANSLTTPLPARAVAPKQQSPKRKR